MTSFVTPLRLDILPPSQQILWEELASTPEEFILYEGTAIALQLGHRVSVDFDFFSFNTIRPELLLRNIPYLKDATVSQQDASSLTCLVNRNGPVKVSFFGFPWLRSIQPASEVQDHGLKIASLQDLGATKSLTVQHRAEIKDYLDIDALIEAGISLPLMLSSATAIHGKQFNPQLTLTALSYFEDGNVSTLPQATRRRLIEAVRNTDLNQLIEGP